MKKLLFIVGLLAGLSCNARAFDVYSSTSPTPAASSGTLCGKGTIAYLYSVCESSPVAATFITVFSSAAPTATVQNTGGISGAGFGCITYQTNYGTNGLSYSKSTSSQWTITYGCN